MTLAGYVVATLAKYVRLWLIGLCLASLFPHPTGNLVDTILLVLSPYHQTIRCI